MKLVIRPMGLDDVSQVHEIDILSISLPWPERSFRYELLENSSSRLWVVEGEDEAGKRILAFIVLWLIIDEAHIGTIAVHPDFRRLGLGQMLLAHALLRAASEGVTRVFLEVRRGNISAQMMYQKFGFILDGVRPRYYQDTGEDAFLLSLSGLQEANIKAYLRKLLVPPSGEQASIGG